MQAVKEISDVKHVRILMDKKRQDVLRVFRNHNRPMTVSQIAEALGTSPANVHFHVKKLEDIDVLRIEHTEEVRGIVAKYYEPTAMVFRIVAKDIDAATFHAIDDSFARTASHRFTQAMDDFIAGCRSNECRQRRLSYSDVYLTPEEFEEINCVVNDMIEKYKDRRDDGQKAYKMLFSCIGAQQQEE